MKNLLFPCSFRIVGWLLFVPTVIMGVFFLCGLTGSLSGMAETVFNDVTVIGMALGAMFIVCSEEPNEDEMVRSIRLSALFKAFYVYIFLLVVCTLFVNGLAFLDFMLVNMVLLPMVYVAVFRFEMYRYNKAGEDEEQD
ncbi:MAG: hypothetical protein ACI3Z7_05700 [Candidatus Aphodosoma sp.]